MKLRRRNSSGGEPRRRRDAVHLQLEREDRLRRAEAAEGAVRRGVGRDRLRADPDVRTVVGTGGVNRPARQHDRRQRAVRAAVDDELDVHRQQPAVGVDRRAMPRSRRMPLGRGDHVLEPVVDHLHGPAGLPREQRGVTGEDRRVFLLAAESAAGLHLHDANALGRQVEQTRRARGECSRGTASSPTPSRPPADRRRRACRSARCRAAPARRCRTRPRRPARAGGTPTSTSPR